MSFAETRERERATFRFPICDQTIEPVSRSINDALTIWQGIVLDTGAENQVKVKAYIGEDNTYKRYEGRNALRSTMSELRSEFP